MENYRSYLIFVLVYLFILSSVSVVTLAATKPAETQIDILETIPEATESLIEHEISIATEPVVEETEPPTEPSITYTEFLDELKDTVKDVAEEYEPVIKETEPAPKPIEPPAEKETEPKPKPTEPPVEEEAPVVEKTEPTEPEPTEPPVEEETTPKDPYDPVELLACVIYQEAGSDSICDDCRYRVADVVLNRVADPRYPDTIYGVLTQPSQYGNYSKTGVVWPKRANNSGEKHAVQRAYAIAMSVVAGTHSELYGEGYIYQAQFIQGKDNIYCCGHYFGR